MDIANVVSVTLSLDTKGPKQKGFGVPLILSASTSATWVTSELTRTYTSPSGVAVDFATTTPEYKAASALFGQTPKPAKCVIGRLTVKPVMKWVVGVQTLINSQRYAFKLNGQEVFFTSDGTALATEIITGLKAYLDGLAISGVSTAAITGGTELEITGTAGTHLYPTLYDAVGQNTGPGIGAGANLLSLHGTGAEPGTPLADQLDAILAQNSDWYCLLNPYYSKANTVALAAWIQTAERIYLQSSPDTSIVTTVPSGATDVVATLKTSARSRVAVIYHHDPVQFADVAWAGKKLPLDPGKDNWAFAELTGVATSTLSQSQIDNCVAYDTNTGKNGNVYVEIGGLGTTWNGHMADQGWVDLVRGGDWIVARLRERMFAALHGTQKIAQSNAGIGVAESILRGVVKNAQSQGILSLDKVPTYSIPKIADIDTADLQLRVLPDMDAEAYFGGAFNHVKFSLALRV